MMYVLCVLVDVCVFWGLIDDLCSMLYVLVDVYVLWLLS